MKPFIFITGAIVVFLFLAAAAFVWDSARALSSADAAVEERDAYLKAQEERFISLLASLPEQGPELPRIISEYKQSPDRRTRHAAFEKLVAASQKQMFAEVDPTDPLKRRFADDFAGALNRRQIGKGFFDQAVAEYDALAQTTRGKAGRWATGLPAAIK
jgi:hypothetical protein